MHGGNLKLKKKISALRSCLLMSLLTFEAPSSHVLQWLVSSADFPQLLPPQFSKIALKLGVQILGARSDA
jgi:uncharacterized protein YpmS